MYENPFPDPEDLVMAVVRDIQEMGAYVTLPEYADCQGMIMLSEVSRRRIRSINRLLRVGRQEVCMVVRVDQEKGYIDLSKRRVSPEDVQKMEEKWSKSRTVHSIMRHTAGSAGVDLEDLYRRVGWPLYRKYGHAYDAFRLMVADGNIDNPSVVEANVSAALGSLDIRPEEQEELLKNIRRKLTPQATKIRADIDVTCFDFEGIDAIKEALLCGARHVADTAHPVKIRLLAPPTYIVTTTALQRQEGLDTLTRAVEVIQKEIEARRGKCVVKIAPRAVSERDDRLLSNLMEELVLVNQEVPGDDENGDDSESSATDSDE
jgi:translation initiation factor 2 subunit 1